MQTGTENMPSSSIAVADLSLHALSANICAELAAGLIDPAGVKRRYELSDTQWNKLKANPIFRGMLRDAIRRFSGDLNAGKRITLKSEIALEDSIILLHDWAHDKEVGISSRLEAIKQLAILAGRTAKTENAPGGPSGGGGFNVNIVIKGNERHEVIDLTSTPQLEAKDAEIEEPSSP